MEWAELQQHHQAEFDFGTFIDLYADEPDVLLAEAFAGRAYALKRQGHFHQAIDDYTREIGLNPNSAIGYLDRSLCYDELGDFASSRADYERAIELDPDVAELAKGRPTVWKRRPGTGDATCRA